MNHLRPALFLAAVLFGLDQAIKEVVLRVADRLPVPVTPFFNLVMVWNPGISFGMLGGDDPVGRWVLVALTAVIVLGLLIWLYRESHLPTALALGSVVGGAIGNVVDRLHHGAVVDYLDFYLGSYHWPSFNLADVWIVTGALLLVAESFIGKKKEAPS